MANPSSESFYSLGERIHSDLYRGISIKENIVTAVTIQIFPSVQEAYEYVSLLRTFNNCPQIAKAIDFSKEYDSERGLAFLETLTPFYHEWVAKKSSEPEEERVNKQGMWKLSSCGTHTSGVGDTFKKVFKDVSIGLEALHKANCVHGLLGSEKGVMFDANRNIKLLSFDMGKQGLSGSDLVQAHIHDLKAFKKLVKNAVAADPPRLPYVPHAVRDLESFYALFRYKDYPFSAGVPSEFFRDVSRWIFQSPLFWDDTQVIMFFEVVNQLIAVNYIQFVRLGFLQKYKHCSTTFNWQHRVKKYGGYNMIACLNFENSAGLIYIEGFGVIRFVRNYMFHPNSDSMVRTDVDYQRQLTAAHKCLQVFPGLLGDTYVDVFLLLRNETMSRDGPPEWRGQKFWTYFWTAPSPFDLARGSI